MGAGAIAIRQHLRHPRVTDLPDKSETIRQPAAGLLLATLDELVVIVVDLVLRLAMNKERNRAVEFSPGSTVDRRKILALELEAHRHHRTLEPESGIAITRDIGDPRIVEYRDIEIDGFFRVVVEPEMRDDFMLLDGHFSPQMGDRP